VASDSAVASEASLLTLIGCAAGLAFGAWSLRLLVALLPAETLTFLYHDQA